MADTISKKTVLRENIGIKLSEDKISELAKKLSTKQKPQGPQTEEGRKNSLRNLRIPEKKEDKVPDPPSGELPDDDRLPIQYLSMETCWDDNEKDYFVQQWERYTQDFEMNTSADEALLTIVIMEEIAYNRLYIAQMSTPSVDLSKPMTESIKRHNDSVQKLGISRTQRLGARTGKEDNIASLVQEMDKNRLVELASEKEEMLTEEEALIKKKRLEMETEISEIEKNRESMHEDKREDVINPHKEPEDVKKEELGKQRISEELKTIFDIAALR